jgi:dihydrodipicolinate synthase/N-acetylneuraminate lyase
MFSGTYTALITPSKWRNRCLHSSLIDRQIAAAGVNGIVPVGTTGNRPLSIPTNTLEQIRSAVEFAGMLRSVGNWRQCDRRG